MASCRGISLEYRLLTCQASVCFLCHSWREYRRRLVSRLRLWACKWLWHIDPNRPLSYYSIAPPEKSPSGDILPVQIRPQRIFTCKISPGETFYTNLHELIVCLCNEKSAYPIKNPLPLIKMSHVWKTLLVTEVGRSSQWKILSPWECRPFYLKFLWRTSNFLATVSFH